MRRERVTHRLNLLLALGATACGSQEPWRPWPITNAQYSGLPTVESARIRRVGGDTLVIATEDIRRQMRAFGSDRLVMKLELCIDETGHPRTLRLEQPSGIADYDHQVMHAFRDWRFEPVTIDGAPRTVCAELRMDFVDS